MPEKLEQYLARAIGENQPLCPECGSSHLKPGKGNEAVCLDCQSTFHFGKSDEQIRAQAALLSTQGYKDLYLEPLENANQILRGLKQAERLLSRLEKEQHTLQDRLSLSFVENLIADAYFAISHSPGNLKKALDSAKKALRLEKRYYAAGQDELSLFVQAWLLEKQATLEGQLNQKRNALNHHLRVIEQCENLFDTFSEDDDLSHRALELLERNVLMAASNAAILQESELAIKLYERFQGLVKEDYDLKLISEQTYKAVLFLVETSLSTLYHSMNEVDQAVEHRQKAEELQDQIEPDDVYELFVSLGYEIEKEQFMQTAEEIFKEKEESPAASFNEEDALSFLIDFAQALEKMEQEFAALSKNTDAKKYLEQFKNKARRITSRENPDREIEMLALCRTISDTAGFFLNTKHDRKTALELILLAIEIMDQWTKDYPDNLLNSVGTNIILKCLWDGAQIYLDDHQAQKALDFCERGLQLALSLAEVDELLNAEPLDALTKIKKEAQKRLKA